MNDDLRLALATPNVAAFLRVIRAGETSQGPDAYRMLFGGGLIVAWVWRAVRRGRKGHPIMPDTDRGGL